jgi:hypothetical protein
MKLYKPPLQMTQAKLAKKIARLAALEEKYAAATNVVSRASFKGKITRCKRDIERLQKQVDRY